MKLTVLACLCIGSTMNIACQSIPIKTLQKKFTVNQYVAPNRESNINVYDYSLVFVSNFDSKKFKIKSVQCNHLDSKMFLLNTKEMIVTDFNKNDTILLRSSILRKQSVQTLDTLTVYYELKGREKSMFITDFKKIETPINQ